MILSVQIWSNIFLTRRENSALFGSVKVERGLSHKNQVLIWSRKHLLESNLDLKNQFIFCASLLWLSYGFAASKRLIKNVCDNDQALLYVLETCKTLTSMCTSEIMLLGTIDLQYL